MHGVAIEKVKISCCDSIIKTTRSHRIICIRLQINKIKKLQINTWLLITTKFDNIGKHAKVEAKIDYINKTTNRRRLLTKQGWWMLQCKTKHIKAKTQPNIESPTKQIKMLRAWQNKQHKKKLTCEKKKQSSQGYHETSQEGGEKDIERLIKDN